MYAETCGLHMTTDDSYFDITHSFKVGQSTYHILGLRKDYPTYGNNYYIFNCTSENSPSKRLPSIHSSKHRTTPLKKMESDTIVIKEALTKIIKSEHQTLVTSIREEINTDTKSLLRSIEKERDVFAQAVSTANQEKQTIVRLLEEHKSSLQSTYERHISTTISSIELLKTTMIETINAQYERLQILDQFQLTSNETIERAVEKTMMKHLEAYRATSIDINTIQQVQNTMIETFKGYYITLNNDNDNRMKQFVAEQYQHLTNLLKEQLEKISLELRVIKQSQSNEALKQLFIEQRKDLTDLIERQSRTLSLELIKKTVLDALKEQASIGVSDTITTNPTVLPADVVYDQCPFKVSIQTAESAQVYAELAVGDKNYGKELYTLCQRDPTQSDIVNCFVVPPLKTGALALKIYAKTKSESEYRAAITIKMPAKNITEGIPFPKMYSPFQEHQCILIEPLQRFVQPNKQILIHMKLAGARRVKIRNGDNENVLGQDEFHDGVVKTKVLVRGDVIIFGQWNGQTDLAPVCAFKMDKDASD